MQIRSIVYNTEASKSRRSVYLLPQHFGLEAMDAFIREQLRKREHEFTVQTPYIVFCGTWNCAGMQPSGNL